jgi:hypothetical protein
MRFLGNLASKLTYANVVATLALFIALGGASYAAVTLPKNSVGAKQIKKGSISADKLSKSAIKSLAGIPGAAGPAGINGRDGAQGQPGTAGLAEGFSATGSVSIETGEFEEIVRTLLVPTSGTFLVNADVALVAGATPLDYSCAVGPYSNTGGIASPSTAITVPANATRELHIARSFTAGPDEFFRVTCASTSGAATATATVSAVPYDDYALVK